jgi:hypothetical protein
MARTLRLGRMAVPQQQLPAGTLGMASVSYDDAGDKTFTLELFAPSTTATVSSAGEGIIPVGAGPGKTEILNLE